MNLVWQREGRVIGRTGNKVALLRHDGSWSWFRESDGEHLQDEVRLPLPNRWDPFLPRPQLSPDLKLAIAFDGEQRFAIVDLRAGTTSWFDAPFPVVKVLTSDRHIVLTGHETVIAVTGWDGATRRQISLDQQITPEVGRWLSDTLLFVARAGGLPVAADVDSGECFEFSGPTSIDDDVDPWVTRGVPHMSRATPKTVWLAHYNERVDGFDWHNRRHVAWAIAPEPVTGLGVHSDAIVCGTIGGSVHCYAPDHA